MKMTQRDQSKLKEAQYRRSGMKVLLLASAMSLVPYAVYLISGGYRDILGLGHWSLAIALLLLSLAVLVGKPIYRLEYPFQHSLDKKRSKE